MKTKPSILVVEDEILIREVIKSLLRKKGYAISEAKSLAAADKQLKRRRFDLILLDIRLPDGSGLKLLEEISGEYKNKVIIVSGAGTVDNAVEAMRKGAFDFLRKPVEHNVLAATVKKALEVNRQLDDFKTLKDNLNESRIEKIIYKSSKMADVVKKAQECADSSKTILITGETGTGKELIAHAIHNASPRKNNPFIIVNCATIPLNLAESELFGFERGAFTGADQSYPGKFRLADKGTIFLDEIGELQPEIQPKLLRVLESGEIFSLKGTRPKQLDIRVIAATNRDLLDRDSDIEFRDDLYYRVQQVEIDIPPLRKRKADIMQLARHFISLSNISGARSVTDIDKEVQKLLLGYHWPGNVRELKNVIEEIMAFVPGAVIKVEHLPSRLVKRQDPKRTENQVIPLHELEKNHIRDVLKLTKSNIQKTARLLGIGRPALYRKIEKYGLKKK